jgi:hypothetical protein
MQSSRLVSFSLTCKGWDNIVRLSNYIEVGGKFHQPQKVGNSLAKHSSLRALRLCAFAPLRETAFKL